VLYTW